MKANKYVYVVPLDENHFVMFNGINRQFLVINKKLIDSYVLISKNPDGYIDSHSKIVEILKQKGLVLDDDIDVHELLKCQRNDFVNALEYKLTIVPTYECNYNCWYCLQNHQPVKLSKEKLTLIVKHAKTYLLENGIKSFILSWFGGEPLTQPNIINIISKEMQAFCYDRQISYIAAITTNGALLTQTVIHMLKEREVNYYQIAIDGDAIEHDKVKYDDEHESSFALILNNIVNLLNANNKAEVTLRLNYTLKMLHSERLVSDINRFIPTRLRPRLSVDLQKVWQIKEDTIPIEDLKRLQKELVDSGYRLNTDHVFSICYVDKIHNNLVYYNGGVDKCDKRELNNVRGYLDENGHIVWNERPVFQDYDLFSDGCVCNKCLYYPLCYCDCPMNREERILKNGKVVCNYKNYYHIFAHRIQDYCWRTIYNKQIKDYKK